MSQFSKDTIESHRAIVRRMMVLNPNQTIQQIMDQFKAQNLPHSRTYITKIVRKVEGEWAHKYDRETKAIATAKVEEIFNYLISSLRKIVQDEEVTYTYTLGEGGDKTKKNKIRTFSQINRIQALKEIRETVKTLISIKQDFGLLERNLGKLEVEFNPNNLRDFSEALYEYQQNNRPRVIEATPQS